MHLTTPLCLASVPSSSCAPHVPTPSLHCLTLWPTVGGLAVVCLNILGNLPFILIQRYNRPRLARLLEKTGSRAALEQENICQAE